MSIGSFFKSKIFPILLVNFIGILGYSIVVPVLVFIVIKFGGNGFIYGILGAMYPFFQFIGAPILGRLSDKIGRKKVLIISQAGTFLAWVLFLLAFALPKLMFWSQDNTVTGSYMMTLPLFVIFIARILDGFTGGNVSVANAYMSDISTDEDRSENFGKMGASTSLGFVLGPAAAGVLAASFLGEVLPLILAAVISLAAIFVIQFRLKETVAGVVDTGGFSKKGIRRFFQVEHKNCYTEGALESEKPPKVGWFSILKISGIPFLFAVYFLTFFAFSLFYAGLPVYAKTMLGWSVIDLGLFLAYSSLIMAFVQGVAVSKISKIVSSPILVLVGSLFLGTSLILIANENIFIMYVGNTMLSLGNGIMWPSFLSILSSKGDKALQGTIQGYGTSMGSIASMFGLVIGGILFEAIGTNVFLLGAGVFFLITVLMLFQSLKNRMIGLRQAKPRPTTNS